MGIIEGAEDRDKMVKLGIKCTPSWEMSLVNDTQSEALVMSLPGIRESSLNDITNGIVNNPECMHYWVSICAMKG